MEHNTDLHHRMDRLSERLDQIERQMAQLQKKPADPITTTTSSQTPLTSQAKSSSQVVSHLYELPTRTPQAPQDYSRLLGVIASICFVLAGLFIVKLAIDSGWLTPPRQLGLSFLFGLSLALTGRFLEKIERDYRIYLSASGVIVLYMAAYSSFLYFKLVGPETAISLAMLVSVLTLWMFHFHRNESFAVIAVVGTFLIPTVLHGEENFWMTSGFFLLWAAVFSYCSTFFQSRTLSLLAAYASIGVFASTHLMTTGTDHLLPVVFVQVMLFFIFAGGVVHYSVTNKNRLSEKEAISYFPVLVFFYGTTYYFIDKISPTLAPWISLSFAGFVWLFYILAKNRLTQFDGLHSKELVYTFLGVCLAHAGYFQILPDTAQAWVLPVLILAEYISKQKELLPRLSRGFRLIMLLIAGLEFIEISFGLLGGSRQDLFPALITIVLGIVYYMQGYQLMKDSRTVFLNLIHIFSILTLYRLVYDFGSLAVSGVWAIYAGIILFFGFQRKDKHLARSSLVVVVISALKALIYDASQATSLVRVACLIMTGLILYGAGFLFQKVQKWESLSQ